MAVTQPQNTATLTLLGRPSIFLEGVNVTPQIKYRKALALLGYLAANTNTWFERAQLADLLWPHLEMGAARTNLRQVINNLGAVLNGSGAVLQKDGKAAAFFRIPGVHLDLDLLSDKTLDRIASDTAEARHWRRQEIEPVVFSMGGDFLSGIQLPDAPEFEAWLEAQRLHFRVRRSLLLENLCRAQRNEGRLAEAVITARRMVAQAPLDENSCSILATLLMEGGDARAALETLETFRQGLDAEMGVPPGAQLLALRDEITWRLECTHDLTGIDKPEVQESRLLVALYCVSDLLKDDEASSGFAEQVRSSVHQRGGKIISSLGKGMLAVFGLGETTERSMQRAILAARDLVFTSPFGAATRIGIAAGQVLLRQTSDMPLAGDMPDVAKMIGWSAQNGEIWVCEAVALQAGEWYRFEYIGERSFPGLEEPYALYRLSGEAQVPSAVEPPLSGRSTELEQLQALWGEAVSGSARVAVLRAPAGMGKTRLASALTRWVKTEGGRTRRIQCSLEHQHEPLSAVLAAMGPAFVNVGAGDRSKSAIFTDIMALLNAETTHAATLLVVDDLHWSDLATRELLGHLVKGLAQQKLMLVVTTRPEIALSFPENITHTIDLAPLDEAASLSLVATHDASGAIPPAERAHIIATSAGIPLYIERLVKSWLEGGHHSLTVTELLRGELDHLGYHKPVLHAAAVLGNRFERRHLAALIPDDDIAAALARAVDRRLIEAVSANACVFKHALIRDAAYESLTVSRRKLLHERAARIFVRETPVPTEEVAQHYTAAGCREEAIEWWIKAGDDAMAREFGADAMVSFRQALDLLEEMGTSDGTEFMRSVRMRLGYAAHVAEGYGSPLTHRLFTDMAAEIEAIPNYHPSQMFSALSGCYMGSSCFGKDEGLSIARRLHSLARTDAERLMASFALGNTLFWLGDFRQAAQWQEECLALAETLPFKERIRYGVDDIAITCRAFIGWTQWFLGNADAALAVMEETVKIARKGQRTHTLCFALTFATCLHWCRGDVTKVAELASETLALAKQYGFPLWEGGSSLLLLWALAKSGQMADARDLFGAAAMLQQALPSRITTSRWIIIHALLARDEWDEAEKLLDTALREVEHLEEQYCVADLLRLKGECLTRRGLTEEAQAYLAQSEALAKAQNSLGLLRRFEARSDEAFLTL